MKIISLLFVSILFFSAVSCSKPADVAANNCESAAKKVEETANTFIADPTNKAKCQAYADAIGTLLRDCPTYYTGAAKQAIVDFQKNGCK